MQNILPIKIINLQYLDYKCISRLTLDNDSGFTEKKYTSSYRSFQRFKYLIAFYNNFLLFTNNTNCHYFIKGDI